MGSGRFRYIPVRNNTPAKTTAPAQSLSPLGLIHFSSASLLRATDGRAIFSAMGGNLSKALAALQKKPEEPEVLLEDPPTPPAPDPRLPLTARQLFNISKSWKGIARAMEPTGITMFVRLFEENEDILHLFQKFQYKRIHELHRDSMELAQHAGIVMNTLDESIKKLDNVDCFMDYLHSVGMLHTKIPGFRRDYFWRIESPFLAAVQDTLGDRYTDNMENIYKITIRYILNTVVKGFDLGCQQSESVQPPKASPEPSPSPQDNKEGECATTSKSQDVVPQ